MFLASKKMIKKMIKKMKRLYSCYKFTI